MALTTIDFQATFELNKSPKIFEFKDLTDYAGQSVALTDVRGVLKVVDPNGNVHFENTDFSSPDIDPDVSLFNSTTITIPLLANGNVIPGTYTFTYRVEFDDSVLPAFVISKEKKFNFTYVAPSGSVQLTSNCVTPELISTDKTAYVVGGITPTITRTHKLFFPPELELTELTGTGVVLETGNFFTESHSSSISSVVLYDFLNDFFVLDTITGTTQHDVVCDSTLCDLFCCLLNLYKRYIEALADGNKTLADQLLPKFLKAMSLRSLIKDAIDCNKGSDVSALVADVLALGDCEPGCGCDGDEPIAIIGLGGNVGTTTVVDTCGNGIEITQKTSGDTTTYTVCLQSALIKKINSFQDFDLIAGTNITIDVVNNSDGSFSYTFNSTGAGAASYIALLFELDFNTGFLPTITKVDETIVGTDFQASTVTNQNGGGVPAWQANNNKWKIANYLAVSGTEHKPQIELVDITSEDPTGVETRTLGLHIFNYDTAANGSLEFNLYSDVGGVSPGIVPAGDFVDSTYDKIKISLTIHL